MLLLTIQSAGDALDTVLELLEKYEQLGPLPGFLLPFIEAFLPFLPLLVFVLANSVAYGLLKGFILSWLGAALGSIAVFLLIRRLSHKKWLIKLKRNRQVVLVTTWLERHGFGLLFLLLCFPFSPSSVINIVAALSFVSKQQFILAVLLGKSVMIFSIAYVGSSLMEFAQNPIKTIIVLICILIFWIVGKYIENRMMARTKTQFESRVNQENKEKK